MQLEFTDSMPEIEPLRCPGAAMAVHVPKQIQDKIMSHQYINLALLLKGSLELAEICSGATLHINEKGGIESRPKVTKQAIRNIDEWTDAFIVFASICLQKYHDKSIDILRHMSILREAATRYPASAWRTYDEQCRLRQVSKSTRPSWGSLNGELWLRVMTIPQSNAAGLGSMVKPVTLIHQNSLTCNAFNDGNCTWNSCKFRMYALLAILHYMVDVAVHMYFREMQLDSSTATHHKITDFFEAEDLQGGMLCQEADLTADNITGSTDVHLYTLAKTPVDINALEKELEVYHANDAKFILNGFMHGFPLNHVGPHLPSKSRNLKLAITWPEITQQKIDKEVAEGRVGGPFAYPPFQT